MTLKVTGNKLTIELDLNPTPPSSKSGKSLLIGGSGGFVTTEATYKGKPISIGLNVCIPK